VVFSFFLIHFTKKRHIRESLFDEIPSLACSPKFFVPEVTWWKQTTAGCRLGWLLYYVRTQQPGAGRRCKRDEESGTWWMSFVLSNAGGKPQPTSVLLRSLYWSGYCCMVHYMVRLLLYGTLYGQVTAVWYTIWSGYCCMVHYKGKISSDPIFSRTNWSWIKIDSGQ
jgi:hypothetical protein